MDKRERKSIIKQRTKWPTMVALLGAVLMVLCVFLPYSTVTDEREEWIDKHPDTMAVEEMNLTSAEVKNVSMVRYAYIYNTIWHESAVGMLAALIMGGALVAALFAWGRKPIGALIFGGLSYGVFCLMNLEFTDKGIIPSDSYDWGLAHSLLPIAAAILVAGVIWMFVEKIIVKKQLKQSSQEEIPTVE